MEFEKLITVANTLTAILEEEGIMSVNELRDIANLKEKEVSLALDWLNGKQKIEYLPSGNVVSVMLVF